MDTLFTYSYIETLAGSVAATVLVIHFIQNFAFLRKIPIYITYYITAELIIILPHLVNSDFNFKEIPLYLLNGLLVSATAMKTNSMTGLADRNGGIKL